MKRVIFSVIIFLSGLIFVVSAVSYASDSTKLIINVPSRDVTLVHQGKQIFQFPIAIGSRIYKTPIGPRFLKKIVWNPWWIPPDSDWARNAKPTPPGPGNPLGVVKMDLGRAILLHGTNKEWLIGRAVSHGCMRMKNNDARQLAWWIQTHFTDKKDPLLIEKYKKKRGQSFHVNLSYPLPVEIQYDIFHLGEDQLWAYPDLYGRKGEISEKIVELLGKRGYRVDRLHQMGLARFLKRSQRKSSEISLRDLFPGTITISPYPVPDPIDEDWKAKKRRHSRPDFTFLFPVRSI